MNRRNLLKSIGVLGLGTIMPFVPSQSKAKTSLKKTADCWLTPEKTEGPFYFDSKLFRQDIRTDNDTKEFHDGVRLNMLFTVVNADCSPVSNALIDVWHCDTQGFYSGYFQPRGDTSGQDFMRGTQITDANGQASFITSYPGWYPGRATHIHFKVRLNSTTYVTSQFAFPNDINDEIYATSLYSGRGANPMSNQEDNIFGTANPEYLTMSIVKNSTDGYDGTFTIGINSPTGVNEQEQNPQGFHLEQNFPNPFNPSTTIRYTLPSASDTTLSVYDIFGKEIKQLVNSRQTAGLYEVRFDAAGLSSGIYFYRLIADDYTSTKEMLLIK